MTAIVITRAGPLATLQDAGRFGCLGLGISASGPMDFSSHLAAGALLETAGSTAVELAQGLAFEAEGELRVAMAGGAFRLRVNGKAHDWPAALSLKPGDRVEISPGASGNYGYLRFEREVDVAPVLGSRATNVTVGLGGFKGRPLRAGDRIPLGEIGVPVAAPPAAPEGPIRILWGLHADLFDNALRQKFSTTEFRISATLDRMGVRMTDIAGIFHNQRKLGLVSDAIVPGDIQILGDGTPIVLMRDHQPTGGYPRIATVVSADLDRFAQLRPGTPLTFRPVSLEHAR